MTVKYGILMGVMIAGALALVFLVLPYKVVGRNFHCDEVWKKNSTTNKPEQCVGSTSHVMHVLGNGDHIGWTIMISVVVVVLLVTWVTFPIFMIGRYFCGKCGHYRRRPGASCCGGGEEWDHATSEEKANAYAPCGVTITKIGAVVGFVVCVEFAVMILIGTTLSEAAYDEAFLSVGSLLAWVEELSLGMRVVVTNNSTGALISPFNEELFMDIEANIEFIRGEIQSTRRSFDEYVNAFHLASYFLMVVPFALTLCTVVCALMHVRRLVPLINLTCHCICLLPYTLFAVVFVIFGVLVGDVCGERAIFLDNPNKPGLVAFGLQPVCKVNAPFETVKQKLEKAIAANSRHTCETMLMFCDANPTYSNMQPLSAFYCYELYRDGAEACDSLATAKAMIDATILKRSNPYTDCRTNVTDNRTAYAGTRSCTFRDCSTDCTREDIRGAAAQASDYLQSAVLSEYAFRNYAIHFLDCGNIYRKGMEPMTSCDDATGGFVVVGAGFWGMVFLLVFDMVTIVRGQKRFFKPAPNYTGYKKERTAAEASPVIGALGTHHLSSVTILASSGDSGTNNSNRPTVDSFDPSTATSADQVPPMQSSGESSGSTESSQPSTGDSFDPSIATSADHVPSVNQSSQPWSDRRGGPSTDPFDIEVSALNNTVAYPAPDHVDARKW